MLKILFIALSENEHMRGVERYCYETIKALSKNKEVIITILLADWQTYYDTLKSIDNINFMYYTGNNSKISRHLFLISKIKNISKNFDIIHYGNTMPYFLKNDIPTFMTIHDIAEYFVPEKYSFFQILYRKMIVKISSKLTDYIVTVSYFSKKSISEELNIKLDKIIVTYNGVEHFSTILENDIQKKTNRILYFGVIEDSKGIQELIEAFKISKVYNNYELHLVGKEGNVYEQIKKEFDNKRIFYHGFMDDYSLQESIKNSSLVVYPSKYEGFGLPALEAFCLNDNILSSSLTSLGEVTKEFAWQINPNNIKQFSEKLSEAIIYPKKFNKKEKYQILNIFSWEKSSEKLLQNYKKAIND